MVIFIKFRSLVPSTRKGSGAVPPPSRPINLPLHLPYLFFPSLQAKPISRITPPPRMFGAVLTTA